VIRVFLIILGVSLLLPAQATAKGAKSEARRHAIAGIEAFHDGRADVALRQLQRAEALFPAVTHRVYIARSLTDLDRLVEAAAAYDALLAESRPPRPSPAAAEAYAAAAGEREALAARLPRVKIVVDGEGSFEVRIDGRLLSGEALQEPVAIDPGEHRAVIANPGGPPREVTFEAKEGQTVALTLVPSDARAGDDLRPLIPALIAYGVGGSALVTGVVTGALSLQRVADIDEQCSGKSCPSFLEDDAAVASDLGNASTVAFVIAGAALTTAVVLTLLQPGESAESVALAPTLGPGFIGLQGHF